MHKAVNENGQWRRQTNTELYTQMWTVTWRKTCKNMAFKTGGNTLRTVPNGGKLWTIPRPVMGCSANEFSYWS